MTNKWKSFVWTLVLIWLIVTRLLVAGIGAIQYTRGAHDQCVTDHPIPYNVAAVC